MPRLSRLAGCFLLALLAFALVPGAGAQEELSYAEYRAIAQVAITQYHCAMFEPLQGEPGMYLALGDKFGKVNVFRLNGGQDHDRVWASRQLDGNPEEVLVGDLDGDGLDDSLICRTLRRLYIFDLTNDFYESYESQPNDFQTIYAFTVANVDEDPQLEIVLAADSKIHYIDGLSYGREWTSLDNYEPVRIRCGDVDGDGRMELVLNTGHVLDSGTGAVEWSDQVFADRFELLDIDGDGVLEVLTEGPGQPLRVWDVDFKAEKRFQ
jgi:hypothetical protein